MRNIFDQYSVPENRLTHALACCLQEDPTLARAFVRWLMPGYPVSRQRIRIVEQQIPGGAAATDDDENDCLPDAWLWSRDDDWALVVESKVAAGVSIAQLRRHYDAARRSDFDPRRVTVGLLTATECKRTLPRFAVARTWSDVYAWATRRIGSSRWARELTHFLRVAEAKWVAEDYLVAGALTRFDGFHFSTESPYTAREGRRLIRLMRSELMKRSDLKSLINGKALGRQAITGRGNVGVWDFIRLKSATSDGPFTEYPHLTFGIHADHVEAAITIPNGVRTQLRRNLVNSEPAFQEAIRDSLRGLTKAMRGTRDASPRIRLVQRHFISQNSQARDDALLDFDLRTVWPDARHRVKHQPQWLDCAYQALKNRRSNIQLQVWLKVSYERGVTDSRRILDIVAASWTGCRPLINLALGRR